MALVCSQRPQATDNPVGPGAAVGGQPVEKTVGRRVITLPRSTHDPGHRGKQHKRRQIHVFGKLMQIPGPINLGPQHRIHPRRCQRRDQPIIEHPAA